MGDVSHVVVNLERLLECAEQMLAAPESRAALATPETEENTRYVYVCMCACKAGHSVVGGKNASLC